MSADVRFSYCFKTGSCMWRDTTPYPMANNNTGRNAMGFQRIIQNSASSRLRPMINGAASPNGMKKVLEAGSTAEARYAHINAAAAMTVTL